VRQDFPQGVKEFARSVPIVARPTNFVSNGHASRRFQQRVRHSTLMLCFISFLGLDYTRFGRLICFNITTRASECVLHLSVHTSVVEAS
jgi:hypothetical protein